MDIDAHMADTRKRLAALEAGGAPVEGQGIMKDEAVKSAVEAYHEAAARFEDTRATFANFMEKWEPLLEELAKAKEAFEATQREAADKEAAEKEATESEDHTDENDGSGEDDDTGEDYGGDSGDTADEKPKGRGKRRGR